MELSRPRAPTRPGSHVLPVGRGETAAGLQSSPHCDGLGMEECIHPVLNGWKQAEGQNLNGQYGFPVEPETALCFVTTVPEKPALQSAYIPVPMQRKPSQKAEIDEVIAAAVLTSLSTSPLLLGQELNICTTEPCSQEGALKEGALISSSCSSSTNSGDWNWDLQSDPSGPSTPSPPLSTEVIKTCVSSTQLDDGIEDSDATQIFFGDSIPRKRKNSVKVMFKCLWKNCGKVLSTSSGIQKHIRVVHLGRRAEPDRSDGEEDFYYTEVDVNMESLTDGLSSLTPVSPTSSMPPVFPVLDQSAWTMPVLLMPDEPQTTPLSLSAPTTLCHVHTDHAYQAASPISVSTAAKVLPGNSGFSFSWQPQPVLFRAAPGGLDQVHINTFGTGEKRIQMSQTAAVNTCSQAVSAPPKNGLREVSALHKTDSGLPESHDYRSEANEDRNLAGLMRMLWTNPEERRWEQVLPVKYKH